MKLPLRALIVTDLASDAGMLIRELRRGGYEPHLERADTLDAIDAALDCQSWDVIFANHPTPRFNLAEVLALVRDRNEEVPFIILTSRIAEAEAVAAMKAGADDYILKDSLARLVPAVARELRDAEARRAHKRAADQLVKSENHLRTIIGSEPECVKLLASDGTLLQMNPAGLAMIEADSAEQVLGASVYQLVTPEHRPAFAALTDSVFRGDSGVLQFEIEGLKGTRRWLETHAAPLRNSDNGIVALLSITRDITSHKRTEEALRLSEERCRTLVEHAPEAIVVLDVTAGRFIDGNENAARLFGLTREKLLETDPITMSPPAQPDGRLSREIGLEYIRQAFNGGVPVFEWIHHNSAGQEIPCEVRLVRLPSADRQLVRGSITDITERKRLEHQFRESQKMEAVGRLAGGIAHDFNNLLTAIIGYGQLLLARLDPQSKWRTDVEQIVQAGQRAAALTSQLLTFSRRQVIQLRVLNLNSVVTETEKMLRRMIGEDIDLVSLLDPELGRVKADLSQIQQIIMNLAVNARDAMPNGGKLTIETSNVTLNGSRMRRRADPKPGAYVVLSVTDTGSGMDLDTQSHIFEPFFTTKDVGKGTGLGLSTVYGITELSGGSIFVHSEPGEGTCIKIFLPQVEQALDSEAPVVHSGSVPCGTETVLLVEDDSVVRQLAKIALAEQGYSVLEASDGEQALRVSAENGDLDIALLVTDVVMPLMGGKELTDRIKSSRPNMKVLFVSGYADDAAVPRGSSNWGPAILQKPFAPSALALKVRQTLDA